MNTKPETNLPDVLTWAKAALGSHVIAPTTLVMAAAHHVGVDPAVLTTFTEVERQTVDWTLNRLKEIGLIENGKIMTEWSSASDSSQFYWDTLTLHGLADAVGYR